MRGFRVIRRIIAVPPSRESLRYSHEDDIAGVSLTPARKWPVAASENSRVVLCDVVMQAKMLGESLDSAAQAVSRARPSELPGRNWQAVVLAASTIGNWPLSSEQPRHGRSLVSDSCPSTSLCVAGTTMVVIHPSRSTASRAALCGAETCAMPVGNPRHNFRDPHCQHLGVLVTIHEQRRRGGSVQQQVAAVFLGAEVRHFHGLGCRFQHRETGQVHFGLPDGRCPSPLLDCRSRNFTLTNSLHQQHLLVGR